LPGWQALHEELEALGLTVVTVALDVDPEQARSWIEKAQITHPSLIDSTHLLDELLGVSNVPMAVWIDESGNIVRPAESASIEQSPFRDMAIDNEWPERIKTSLTEIKKMPDIAEDYRAAIVRWASLGEASGVALRPHEVLTESPARSFDHAKAAACFELGHHLHTAGDHERAIEWWKQAHQLHPENWTYKRQAWTLETTPAGAPSDLQQEATATYGTTWLDDVLALGGGAAYGRFPELYRPSGEAVDSSQNC
jgi:hypothetical protein